MATALRIILIEDSDDDAALVQRALAGLEVAEVCRILDGEALRTALRSAEWDLVISDWSLPGFTAPDALKIVQTEAPGMPFIIVSGTVGEEAAVQAIRAGAHDYVLKDRLSRLAVSVEREVRDAAAHRVWRATQETLTKTEHQLRQLQKMETVGRLAGGIAHDFNNILSVIMSYADLVANTLPAEHPCCADVREICAAGERASGLTKQLLTFSRKQMLEPRPVNLNDTIRGIERMLARLLGEDVAIVTRLSPALAEVLVDPVQMDQVLMNLAINARDAMPSGGTLSIETANSLNAGSNDLSDGEHHTYVALKVTDTGIGMDEPTRVKVFEPFFTTKEAGRGTGLGLSIVLGIVDRSGGAIEVDSKPGEGASFRIYFPAIRHQPELASVSSVSPAHDLSGNETILVVEDDDALRQLIRRVLSLKGYRVLVSSNGPEALSVAQVFPGQIDMLLTDVVLPRMSGPSLVDRLAAENPNTKILYMSGHAGNHGAHDFILRSGAPFIVKPITPSKLLRKVRQVLSISEPATPFRRSVHASR